MPYPNFHSCRLADPKEFKEGSFKNIASKDGKAQLVMAKRPGESKLELQAVRYPKDKWTADAAKGECEKHGGSFEAAVGKSALVEALEDMVNQQEESEITVLKGIPMEMSLGEMHGAMNKALDALFPYDPQGKDNTWASIVEAYLDGTCIVRLSDKAKGERYMKYAWGITDGVCSLTDPVEVTQEWEEVEKAQAADKAAEGEKAERDMVLFIPIAKVDDEKQIVYGVVLEPETVDAQGDIISADEIEKACHDFMRNYRAQKSAMGLMHKREAPEIDVVECAIAPADFKIGKQKVKKGSWYMGSYVSSKKIWKDIKDGKLTGYSIGGRGQHE